jgi:hypothetical protein
VIPTDTLYLNIDKQAVLKSGMMLPKDSTGQCVIPERMAISLTGKRALYKGDLMLLEMVAHSNWVRPLYVALTVGSENYMNLGENFIQEGLVNRITPFATNESNKFDTEKVYDNVMHKFKFGGVDKRGIYLDETVTRMCYTHRRLFADLIKHLIEEGKKDKAREVLAYAAKVLPEYNIPMAYMGGGVDFIKGYYAVGDRTNAERILKQMWKNATQYLDWYLAIDYSYFRNSTRDCLYHFYVMQSLLEAADENNKKLGDKLYQQLVRYTKAYRARGGEI